MLDSFATGDKVRFKVQPLTEIQVGYLLDSLEADHLGNGSFTLGDLQTDRFLLINSRNEFIGVWSTWWFEKLPVPESIHNQTNDDDDHFLW